MHTSHGYSHRAGATFREIINDLKRNEEAAAHDLGVDVSTVREIIAGARPLSGDLLEKACRVWPVNPRDFFPIHDDCPAGLLVMRREDSERSSRVFQRGGRDYYEYRDTVMSRVAMIRPEWIKMLHPVQDNDPENPTVRWNNGHFLYQFTYFIGDVNYYYEWNGRKLCEPMVTGDSVFGVPFAKHSFASRNAVAPGLILALTYGGRLLGDAQHEMGVLGAETSCRYVLPVEDPLRAQAALLRLHAANGAHTASSLAAATGLPPERVVALLAGDEALDLETLGRFARTFQVSLRELLPVLPDTDNGVVIVKGKDAPSWVLPEDRPAYRVKRLAGSVVTPFSKSLDVEILAGPEEGVHWLESGLHQYGYNHGSAPAELVWQSGGQEHRTILRPDDSFYVKPFVPHGFRRSSADGPGEARVLLLRVGGKTVGDAILEMSVIGRESLHRVVAESMSWYNAEEAKAMAAARS